MCSTLSCAIAQLPRPANAHACSPAGFCGQLFHRGLYPDEELPVRQPAPPTRTQRGPGGGQARRRVRCRRTVWGLRCTVSRCACVTFVTSESWLIRSAGVCVLDSCNFHECANLDQVCTHERGYRVVTSMILFFVPATYFPTNCDPIQFESQKLLQLTPPQGKRRWSAVA